jgi:hypothetical protein
MCCVVKYTTHRDRLGLLTDRRSSYYYPIVVYNATQTPPYVMCCNEFK